MDTAASYFLPPFDSPWRIAQVIETPTRIRVEWMQEDSLATDWEISLVSVTQVRTRQGPPDPDEALEAGLLPGITNGSALAQIHEESAQQALFVCTWSGDFAKSDQTLAVRLHVEDNFIVGIACRMRPPIASGAAAALLERMRAAEHSSDPPQGHPIDPERDERFRPQLEPYLRALDDAMSHEDAAQARDAIEALWPALVLAPLSAFALNVHAAEAWAHLRAASSGEPDGYAHAIDLLRKTLDNVEPAEQPDLYRAACTWLAEAYAGRDQAGDLMHAIEACRIAASLDDDGAQPARVARLHLQMALLHHRLARESSEEQAERLRLALAELDRAEALYGVAHDPAGLAETALAKADAVRLLGGTRREHDIAHLYSVAWNILQQDDAREALGQGRYDAMLERVRTSMRSLDTRRIEARSRKPEARKARGVATFVRPPPAVREILLQVPGEQGAVSLEAALRRALIPDISIAPVDSAVQSPYAGGAVATRAAAAARLLVETSLKRSPIVILVPGFVPDLPWELKYLRDHGWLTKALLIMVPASLGFSVRESWERMRADAFEQGLDLPPCADGGALLRLNRDGDVIRRMPFEVLFERGRLLQALEDLLSPQPTTPADANGKRPLAELENKGLVRRVRPRGSR
jgi:tetratricopeptide (TPR) repeat protein